MTSVPPRSLQKALDFVKAGGRLCVRTMTNVTVIDAKTLARFGRVGAWLLREEGESYRLRRGNGSVYLLPGQLEAINEDGRRF
jgi:hypothetical protein